MTRPPTLAVGCALLSSLSWGFGISAVKHALGYLPPAHLLLIQLVFSAAVIAVLAAIERSPRPSARQTLLGAATGVLEFGLGYGVGTIGLYLTTASNTSLISTTESFFVLLLAWLILREPMTRLMALCGIVAAAGLTMVVAPDVSRARLTLLGGDALLLLQYFCGGLYAIVSRRIVAGIAPLILCAIQFAAGSLFVIVLVVAAQGLGIIEGWPELTATALMWAFISGMLQFALPFWLHLVALRHMPASVFSFFLALVPVFGVIGAMLFLGEQLSAIQIVGGVLLVGALLPVARQHDSHGADEQPASHP
jgi:drug/metabolite transporter (DMT)-like permease